LVLLTLGGALKRKEMLSARLGDILSELYLLSAALKRFEDEGRREEDRPLLDWCMADGLARIDRSLDAVLANLPSRVAGVLLRAITMPNSRHRRGPSDELTRRCAAILMTPSAARDRLTAGLSLQGRSDGVGHLEDAFLLVTEAEPIMARLKQAGAPNWREAAASGLLTEDEAGHMAALEKAVDEVIAVDDFPPDAFARRAPDRADGNAGADGTARADKNGSADKTASNVEAAE
jgi:hypothetical protein